MAYKTFVNGYPLNASELNNYLMNQSVMVFSSASDRSTNLTSPVEGMISYLQDTNRFESYDGSTWSVVYTSPSSGNAIINGAFDIWQRGTSITSAGQYIYTADRWKVFTDTGVSSVNTQQAFTPGSAPVAGYEGAFFLRSTKSANNGGWVLDQLIEDVRTFAGQTVTLSFWAKAESATTITPKLTQYFGSGGSAQVSTTGNALSLTTSWQRFSLTFSLPSIAGKTIGTNSYLDVRVWDILDANAYTFDIWGVQLEAGSVATPFKRNAPSIQAELAACQRYMEPIYAYAATGTAKDTTTGLFNYYLKVPKRSTPTLSFKSTTYGFDITSVSAKTGTGQAPVLAGADLVCWNVTGSSGLTTGQHLSWNGGTIWVESEL